MTAALIAALSMIVIGLPIALAIDRSARGPLLIGTAFLYGSGWIFLDLLALSILHIGWTIVTVTIVALLPLLLFFTRHSALGTRHFKFHWLDIATLVTLAGYALFATAAPLWEWDFWAIWGMKARQFLEAGAVNWPFLESKWNVFVHPDYPVLVPLNFSFVGLLNGGWSDRWLGILCVGWAAALVLIVRNLASRETTVVPAALVALTIAPLAANRYVGMAEGPLIAFGSAAVLFIRYALQSDDAAAWRHGALILGLAANIKNEGLALLVAVAASLLVVRPRAIVRLWPAFVLAAPWQLLRAMHTLPTDIVEGSVFSRVIARLPNGGMILLLLLHALYEPWFWVFVLAGVVILPPVWRRRERFVLCATGIQAAFYIGSYFATPRRLQWHVATSWSRLTDQIAVPITVAVFLALAGYVSMKNANENEKRDDAEDDEPRGDEGEDRALARLEPAEHEASR